MTIPGRCNKSCYSMLSMLLVLAFLTSCSSGPKFESYGHYAQSGGDPIALQGFQFEGMYDHFQGSDVNNTISMTRDSNGLVKLWVYQATKSGDYVLLTDLKSSRGEYVCCFNCGSYEKSPKRVCKPVEFVERPQKSSELRLFEANLTPAVYCFMNKETRMGYIFELK